MQSVGGLTIDVEAIPNALTASNPSTSGTTQTGNVLARLSNVSMLPITVQFMHITSSDDKVATAQRLMGRNKHAISVPARPSALTAAQGQFQQESVAEWQPQQQQGVALLITEFRVVSRFGNLLGVLDPSTRVTVK